MKNLMSCVFYHKKAGTQELKLKIRIKKLSFLKSTKTKIASLRKCSITDEPHPAGLISVHLHRKAWEEIVQT